MSLPYDNNTYKVRPLRIYDGDTFTGELDPGFDLKITMTFRLADIDTPEVVGKDKAAGKKKEKYGRYLATVFCDGVNVNEQLIKEGLAIPYMVRKTQDL